MVIGDVSDKGVGSALFMALLRSLLRVYSGQSQSYSTEQAVMCGLMPNDARDRTPQQAHSQALQAVALANDYIAYEHGEEGMFATLFFGVLDPVGGLVSYINAGHDALVVVNADGIKRRLNPTGPAVGLMPGSKYAIQTLHLEPGDILFGFTDGVTEARSPQGELYMRKRFESAVRDCRMSSASTLMDCIKANLFEFIENAPQSDDITMLAIRWGQ
jgi:sigma-B regulation protein RsbU (phosphoserine phosphatase)